MHKRRLVIFIAMAISVWTATGCAVPQPRGQGRCQYIQEPSTKAWYYLYLPTDYILRGGQHPNPQYKTWPLVMTFHGMKPYDSAGAQEREWEKEADIYGYIVCAPELQTSDSFMEYPLTKEHSYVLRDKQAVIAIMDHIFATTKADPGRVLSTSWSCGGYLAHYFPNRFPERFQCIATRLSNFSPKLMIEETVPRYRDKTSVAVFAGDGDLSACKLESQEAVAWYKGHGFKNIEGKMIDNMGHRRIPQVAAAFFARHLEIEPLKPAEAAMTVAQVQMTDYIPPEDLVRKLTPLRQPPPVAVASANPALRTAPLGKNAIPTLSPTKPRSYENTTAGRNYPLNQTPAYDPTPAQEKAKSPRPSSPSTPSSGVGAVAVASPNPSRANWLEPTGNPNAHTAKSAGTPPTSATNSNNPAQSPAKPGEDASTKTTPRNTREESPPANTAARPARSLARRVNVKLSGPAIGSAPLCINYNVDLPRETLEGADCLWMDNGVWIGDEPRGVKILESPGQHHITVLVVTRDNVEFRGSATAYVLERNKTASVSYNTSAD